MCPRHGAYCGGLHWRGQSEDLHEGRKVCPTAAARGPLQAALRHVETGGGDLLNRSAHIIPLLTQRSVDKDCLSQHFYEKFMYQNDFKSVFII